MEPVENIEIMTHNRYNKPIEDKKGEIFNLTSGPGKLCMAMGITNKNNNSIDLCGDTLWIEEAEKTKHLKL